MAGFRALLATKTDAGQSNDWVELTDDDLMDGDVTIGVTHSTLNYKDGLAITGKAPVIPFRSPDRCRTQAARRH